MPHIPIEYIGGWQPTGDRNEQPRAGNNLLCFSRVNATFREKSDAYPRDTMLWLAEVEDTIAQSCLGSMNAACVSTSTSRP